MFISYYFNQQVLLRTFRYLMVATMLISVVETLEHIFAMPFSFSVGQNMGLWLLSWPMYVGLLMPICFFGALVTTYTQLAKSQELAIMQMYVSPWCWVKSIGIMSLVLCIFLSFVNGWLVPWCYKNQADYASVLLSDVKIPRTLEGQFSHVNIGGKKLVLYRDRDKNKGLFIATQLKGDQGITLVSTQNIDIEKIDKNTYLQFMHGQSYTFDRSNTLRYKLTFNESKIPLDLRKNLGGKYKVMTMTADKLFEAGGHSEQVELAWRIYITMALVTLGAVAFVFSDYLTCRRRSILIYGASVIMLLAYYMLMMMVRAKARDISILQVHCAYGGVQLVTIVCSMLMARAVYFLREVRLIGLKRG